MVWIRSHPDLHVSLHLDLILNCLFQQDIRNKTMLKWIFIVLGFVLVMTLVGVWWRVSSNFQSLVHQFCTILTSSFFAIFMLVDPILLSFELYFSIVRIMQSILSTI